ncbi:hypothetical protein GCM10023185_24200 [Hymenobacter saemangeumensis]|uniref:Outer membrane protein beta-barrel domain-containing protein n=1 Tax=Hymenobacter saemangeumensis TaxID=1084522 RepID=A0ABP8IH16_9BACT
MTASVAHAQTSISLGFRAGGNWATRAGDDPEYKPYTGSSTGTVTARSSSDYTRSGLLAPQFGAVLDVRFGKLALQPALLFTQKGVEQQMTVNSSFTYSYNGFPSSVQTIKESMHSISRPNYLEIPLNLVYTTGTDHGFQLFAGPYMAFGVGGRSELEYEGSSSSNGSSSSSSNSNGYYSYGNTFFAYRDTYPGPQPATFNNNTRATPFEASSGAYIARRFDAGVNAGIGYRFSALQVQLGYGLGLVNQQAEKAPGFRDEMPAYYQRVAQLTGTYFFKVK